MKGIFYYQVSSSCCKKHTHFGQSFQIAANQLVVDGVESVPQPIGGYPKRVACCNGDEDFVLLRQIIDDLAFGFPEVNNSALSKNRLLKEGRQKYNGCIDFIVNVYTEYIRNKEAFK